MNVHFRESDAFVFSDTADGVDTIVAAFEIKHNLKFIRRKVDPGYKRAAVTTLMVNGYCQ